MKQTVEDAANEYCRRHIADLTGYVKAVVNGFKAGAEWQQQQSPWISIDERMPENQDIVLVRSEYGGKATAYFHGKNSGFITYGEDAYKVFGDITHWMPIPALEE